MARTLAYSPPVKTPDLETVLEAAQTIGALDAAGIDRRITEEIGDPMLATFAQVARAQLPSAPEELIDRSVHLMVLACLIQREASDSD